jgi:antitoxin ParD1/3/4
MASLKISLPDPVQAFVDEQVAKGGYDTPSEFICALLREAAQERLEELLLEGLNSGPPIRVTDEYWDQKRAELVARHQRPQDG